MINRVILMGRLVADPELKTTNTGLSVTSFRIAVDRSYVKQGEQRQADFFDIVAWRNSAEFICRHFSKGSLIAIDGQLQSRNYQTRDGQNRTAIEVVVDNVSFTGDRRDGGGNQSATYGTQAGRQQSQQGQQYQQQPYQGQTPAGYASDSAEIPNNEFDGMPLDDDLPF